MKKDERVNKTAIVYGANLNFERASVILKWLMEQGLVEPGSDTYRITERGEEILREIDKLATLFKKEKPH
jgi:predicted transcriptional regulator